MKLPGFLKRNDDPEMQPIVCENKGPGVLRLTSYLEAARPDLEEHDEDRVIMAWPGRRTIIPHGYYTQEAVGRKDARVTWHIGNSAPELKGYQKPYKARLMRPWYKKFSEFFSKG